MAEESKQGGIQQLLAAEQEAQQIVANARAAKTAKLRQAKEEAEREVAAFRAQREEEFRKFKSSGDAGSTVKRLDAETDIEIKKLQDIAKAKSAEVTQLLYEYVIQV
eukprot:TRINITY_DN2887_c0_g1_i1.p2 TRINITY_DN2887_c0_g1~~TRINITY_DN2887_c0_g1_i1.p2  ORF type:complete len:107 (+),score=28.69 TRINITY_DN2887_c0_g1_i1:86-406(+)